MQSLTICRDDGVETWSFGAGGLSLNPDAGALDELRRACLRAAADPTLRAVVISDGPGAAPAAIRHAAGGPPVAHLDDSSMREAMRVLQQIAGLPQVVIGAIWGQACGFGTVLLCCADVCLSSETATFDAPPLAQAASVDPMCALVARRVGRARADAWRAGGARWSAAQALQSGLVHEPLPSASLDAAIRQTLEAYLRAGPRAVARTKSLMLQIQTGTRPPPVREVAMRNLTTFAVQAVDAAANLRMLSAKRLPPWGERRR